MKAVFFLPLIVWLAAAVGVRAESISPETIDVTAERLRIKTQRAEHETHYSAAMQACYQRFSVFGCQHEAKRVRREALNELRRQEVVLNDLDRQSKALATLQRIKQNVSPQRQAEQALASQKAIQDDLEQRVRADEKKAAQTKAANAASEAATSGKTSEPLLPDSNRSSQEPRFVDKLKEAEQHRQDNAKNQIEKGSSSAKPLPTPTGL